jgi:FkbM family methyltransferase
MKMISYAQNHEDILLRRAFPTQDTGFYIDVGAAHPVVDSVTKHFYDRGWSGVNVEPLTVYHRELCALRPRDVNLRVCLSDREGTAILYETPDHLGWATLSAEQAASYRRTGEAVVESPVVVTTLARICEEHAAQPFDFLKVDVECLEREVLAGGDWTRWRPRVVLVEATAPSTTVPTHEAWQDILLGADYLPAVFDGLNRWYVRGEDRGLLPALSVPVNITDNFVPYHHVHRVEVLHDIIHEMQRSIDALAQELAPFRTLGPTVARIAHKIKALSSRHPRWAALGKRLLRRAG